MGYVRYDSLAKSLSNRLPKVATVLVSAHKNRTEALRKYSSRPYLAGINELLVYLEETRTVYQAHERLGKIAFLVTRSIGDIEKALEATFTGIPSLASDAMRDLLEIEPLFKDFINDPNQIEAWLQVNEKERFNKFRAGVLRQRLAVRLGIAQHNLPGAGDYKAHSTVLHVNPSGFLKSYGIVRDQTLSDCEFFFWEICHHARNVVFPMYHLRRQLAPRIKGAKNPRTGLPAFQRAWRHMVAMMALNNASRRAIEEQFSNKSELTKEPLGKIQLEFTKGALRAVRRIAKRARFQVIH